MQFAKRLFIAGSSIGLTTIGLVHLVTTKINPPDNSLLQKTALLKKEKSPFVEFPTDLFQMRIPLKLNHLDDNQLLDKYVATFVHSPLFSLERVFIGLALGKESVTPPDSGIYRVGDKVAVWTVISRNDRELLMDWNYRNMGGTTYFRILPNFEKNEAVIQFGSSVNVNEHLKSMWGRSVIFSFHYLYSRLLLANLGLTFWWNNKS